MNFRNIFILALLVIPILTSCKSTKSVQCTQDPSVLKIDKNSPRQTDESITITAARIEGMTLIIDASCKGCFKTDLVWDGSFMKSLPPQVNLFLVKSGELTNNKKCCVTMLFNLAELNEASGGEVVIHLNGWDSEINFVSYDIPVIPELDPVKPMLIKKGPTLPEANLPEDFTITTAEVQGDSLIVWVSYKGSDGAHNFDLIWNGSVMKSLPLKAGMFLYHTAEVLGGENEYMEGLVFDISALKEYADGGSIIIMLRSWESELVYGNKEE